MSDESTIPTESESEQLLGFYLSCMAVCEWNALAKWEFLLIARAHLD